MTCICVTGIGASGTSVVAGCLHKMGVSMGQHLARHPAGFDLYEDLCLYPIFRLSLGRMRQALSLYIATHDGPERWGWKHTLAWKSFSFLEPLLERHQHSLRVVVAHRSLGASIRARMEGRCPPGAYYTRGDAERWAVRAYLGMLGAVEGLSCPVHHISYEDVLSDTEAQLERLAQFAGVILTEEAVTNVQHP